MLIQFVFTLSLIVSGLTGDLVSASKQIGLDASTVIIENGSDLLTVAVKQMVGFPQVTEAQPTTFPNNEGDQDTDDDEDNGSAYCDGTATKIHPTGEELAAQFQVPYEEIMAWFCQGYGFGEIKLAYEISLKTGKSVAELFAMREAGMGWGEIKQAVGYKDDSENTGENGNSEEGENEDEDGGEGRCSDTQTNPNPKGQKLADQYGVSYEEIMRWFCQGYGFGEIDLAYGISVQSGKTVEEVFGMRASGLGWGQIEQELGLKGKPDNNPKDTPEDEKPGKTTDKPKNNKANK